jgi:hypothetical protein
MLNLNKYMFYPMVWHWYRDWPIYISKKTRTKIVRHVSCLAKRKNDHGKNEKYQNLS